MDYPLPPPLDNKWVELITALSSRVAELGKQIVELQRTAERIDTILRGPNGDSLLLKVEKLALTVNGIQKDLDELKDVHRTLEEENTRGRWNVRTAAMSTLPPLLASALTLWLSRYFGG